MIVSTKETNFCLSFDSPFHDQNQQKKKLFHITIVANILKVVVW